MSHVRFSRILFIFHRDIKFYFEVTSYLVIQMVSSLSSGLIRCMNHKLN